MYANSLAQQIRNMQSLLALRRSHSPHNHSQSYSLQHYQGGNGQSSEMERLFQSRIAAAAAAAGIPTASLEAALAAATGNHHQGPGVPGNDIQNQQHAASIELLQRLSQQGECPQFAGGNYGFSPHDYGNEHYYTGSR